MWLLHRNIALANIKSTRISADIDIILWLLPAELIRLKLLMHPACVSRLQRGKSYVVNRDNASMVLMVKSVFICFISLLARTILPAN